MRSTDWDKIAPDYFEHVESPFSKGVKNPLYKAIKQVPDRKRKTVLEVGCGTGTMLRFLSRNFKHVVALDISKKMIEVAQEKNKACHNIEYIVSDAALLSKIRKKFDVVVAVNSILMPNIPKVNKVLRSIKRKLKRGGVFISIIPSFDSFIYQVLVMYDREFEKRKSRKKARRITNLRMSNNRHDFCYGFLYNDCAKDRQKHFFGFEIEYRLRKAGFGKIEMSQVFYPWKQVIGIDDPSYYEKNNHVYKRLWDWVVIAR
jgi:ubiquinone/menaquinone biosynthesis C-methylase UbiE